MTLPRCRKCVLPDSPPDVRLNSQGICNFCEEASATGRGPALLESDFVRILERHRGRERYDCMVLCSGGKDSTAALYYLARRYRLRPLAFTFDHGLGLAEALENVRRATSILGVDWYYFRSTWPQGIFREIVRTRSAASICPVCSLWYMREVYRFASAMGIDLIVGGWTRGQVSRGAPGQDGAAQFPAMTAAVADFIDHHLRKIPTCRDFPRNMEEVLRKHKGRKQVAVSPHWFLPVEKEEFVPLIERELGWKPTATSYPKGSTNCALNFLGVLLSQKHFGFSPYDIEMGQLVRSGEMSREEALELLETDFDPAIVDRVLETLGLSRSDL